MITDMVMPGLTGSTLVQEAGKIRPDLPFILVTGCADHKFRSQVRELNVYQIFQKPVEHDFFIYHIGQALADHAR